ncbi:cell division protein FtsQ/DivIB [Pseudooceanicola sp. C21-150M6]|uniref:cell division protein FtsQ/DivIB n=1 Tax=Pseudooceanicola sp. C21-150M6 TaxID=3434355 RepID=UPI003D7FF226
MQPLIATRPGKRPTTDSATKKPAAPAAKASAAPTAKAPAKPQQTELSAAARLAARVSPSRGAQSDKPDPAPSRTAYRIQRLMLTPAYRLAMRVVLPFALSFSSVLIFMSDDHRRETVLSTLHDLRADFESRPEFTIRLMAVEGATADTEADIREVAQLDFPASTFDLDLTALQKSVEELPAVAQAAVRVRQKGVLEVSVLERQPAALWRSGVGIDLLDAEGVVIGAAHSRESFPDLPMLAGYGANQDVAGALDILRAAGPLSDRFRGLVRVGERRWDLILEPDLRIMLPAERPVLALERVIALQEAQDVLNRDIAALDMRLSARPTLRMKENALEQWRQVQNLIVETTSR